MLPRPARGGGGRGFRSRGSAFERRMMFPGHSARLDMEPRTTSEPSTLPANQWSSRLEEKGFVAASAGCKQAAKQCGGRSESRSKRTVWNSAVEHRRFLQKPFKIRLFFPFRWPEHPIFKPPVLSDVHAAARKQVPAALPPSFHKTSTACFLKKNQYQTTRGE